jgi:hypothetical protein
MAKDPRLSPGIYGHPWAKPKSPVFVIRGLDPRIQRRNRWPLPVRDRPDKEAPFS